MLKSATAAVGLEKPHALCIARPRLCFASFFFEFYKNCLNSCINMCLENNEVITNHRRIILFYMYFLTKLIQK